MFEDSEMEKDWKKLIKLFAAADTPDQMERLLQLFLTMNERSYLIDRYRIVHALLTTDKTQREIAENCHVSIAKITAGSNELKRTPEKTKAFLEAFMKNG